jgi:uncharacterized spore protein YtfJ
MQVEELVRQAQDTITVRRVFADPYEVDGVTVIAAARVGGGGGGGGGHDEKGGEGEGGGFGMNARPAGMYVVRGGDVVWRPAVDVNHLVTVVGAVMALLLWTRARVARSRLRHGA